MLLEDEHGTINLIVPPAIYERDRLVVRSEPLVIAEGILERFASAGGAINVLVRGSRARRAGPRWPSRRARGPHQLQDFSPTRRRGARAAGASPWTDDRPAAPAPRTSARSRRRSCRSPAAVGGEAPRPPSGWLTVRACSRSGSSRSSWSSAWPSSSSRCGAAAAAPRQLAADRKRRIGACGRARARRGVRRLRRRDPGLALAAQRQTTQAEAAIGGVELNAGQEHGRELFRSAARPATRSRTPSAVGIVGPDLDDLRPPGARRSTRSRRAARAGRARCPRSSSRARTRRTSPTTSPPSPAAEPPRRARVCRISCRYCAAVSVTRARLQEKSRTATMPPRQTAESPPGGR